VAIKGAAERVRLETGYNIVFLPVAPAATERDAALTVDYGRGRVERRTVRIPHAGFERAAVKRLSMEAVRPMTAYPSCGDRPLFSSPLTVSSDATVVSSLRPAPGGSGWIVRFYNASGRPDTFEVKATAAVSAVSVSDVDGNPLKPLAGHLTLSGYGLITIRLDRRRTQEADHGR